LVETQIYPKRIIIMSITDVTNEIKKSLDVTKASWSQSTGLVQYNLEAPAKFLVPVITPLRNSIPRVKTVGGTQANWKAITGLDSGNVTAGVSEGNRGAEITPTVTPYVASFVGVGLESSFTFEAEYAAEGFDDVRARNSENLLRQLMIQEEQLIVGGQGTFGFTTCNTPVATLLTGKGSMTPAAGLTLYCVALTLSGLLRSSVSAGVAGRIHRLNADGTYDYVNGGNSQVSAASNAVTTTGSNLGISGTVPAVAGAVAYAWYCGASAATAKIAAITSANTVTLLTDPTGTQFANDAKVSGDYSADALVFDGLIAQAAKSGSGAYVKSLDGAGFTSDGAGGVVEIDNALRDRWDTYRLAPSVMYVNSQEAKSIKNIVIGNGGAPLVRFVSDLPDGAHSFSAGAAVGFYLNPFSLGGPTMIPIKIHPYVPAGTVLMLTEELPYPLSNVSNVYQMKLRRDYYQIEWPVTTRKYGFGVYFDGVLQHYFPPSIILIQNVA
jgi:hypothetical protein